MYAGAILPGPEAVVTFTLMLPSKKVGSHDVLANGVSTICGFTELSRMLTVKGALVHPMPPEALASATFVART